MKKRVLLLFAMTTMTAFAPQAWAQVAQYPVTIIPTGKGPYTFPEGYRTPWDKIEIMVTEKIAPNLFVLHGSQGLDPAHPDASGGRVMTLFGPDGVLLVDTENKQVAETTLKAIRSFTEAPIKVVVNTHIHSDHTGANAFFAKQGALIFSQENLRDEMLRPPMLANGQPAPAADIAGVPVVIYSYNASAPGAPAMTLNMDGETVDFIPMMPSHTAGDTVVRFRKAKCDIHRGFLSQFWLSLRRSGQRRLDQRNARGGGPAREAGWSRYDAHPWPWHVSEEERPSGLSRHAGGHTQQGDEAEE